MGLLDYVKPVPTWSGRELKAFMADAEPGTYHLIDVRRPKEYERGHLPGARLLPLGELADRSGELDRAKPVVTYCAAGVRSRAAAAVLIRAGFQNVHSLSGGVNAWGGHVAKGTPEAGMTILPPSLEPEQALAVLWTLEEGSRSFYAEMADALGGLHGTETFRELAESEEAHKDLLLDIYRDVMGRPADDDFPESALQERIDEPVMEGGLRVSKALEWTRYQSLQEALELSMAIEVNAYDLHLRMARAAKDEGARAAFRLLATAEKDHLRRVTEHLDEFIASATPL